MALNYLHISTFKIYFLAFSISFCAIKAHAQYSLKNTADSIKFFTQQASENWHRDIGKASDYAKKAWILSKKVKDPFLKAEAAAQYGVSFYTDARYDSAQYYYSKAYDIALDNNLPSSYYLSLRAAALGKKSKYFKIIQLIDEEYKNIKHGDDNKIDLLLSQLGACLAIGRTQKADSILNVIEKDFGQELKKSYATRINFAKALFYSKIADFKKSDLLIQTILPVYKETGNILDEASAYLLLSKNAMNVSNFNQSMEFLITARNLYEQLAYQFGMASVNRLAGSLYSRLTDYDEAAKYLYAALSFFEENDNVNEVQKVYYELSGIFYTQRMYERAADYCRKSIKLAEHTKNFISLGDSHNAAGNMLFEMQKTDTALIHFEKAIHYFKKTKNIKSMASAQFHMAEVLEKTGQEQKALTLFSTAYQVNKSLPNRSGIAEGELALGAFHLRNNNFDSAAFYLNQAEKNAEQLSNKTILLKVFETKASLFKQLNNYTQSSSYLEKALALQSALFEKERKSDIAALETSYELKNKEKELLLLNLQMENTEKSLALNKRKIQSQNQLLIALSAGIFLLLLLIYLIYRYSQSKNKANKELRKLNLEIQEKQEEIVAQSEELKESNEGIMELNLFLEQRVTERTADLERAHTELDKFFYRASHDFRGPLTTMMGLVEVSRLTETDPTVSRLFDNVNYTAKKLDKMVRKLQSVSFLSTYQELPEPEIIHPQNFISELIKEVEKEHPDKTLRIEKTVEMPDELLFYPNLLKICLSNLLENSVIFNLNKTIFINILFSLNENHIELTVADNGQGIPLELQANIFDMFERSSNISKGNGLGLYLVKKAVGKLNGSIKLHSDEQQGSVFELKFPQVNSAATGHGAKRKAI